MNITCCEQCGSVTSITYDTGAGYAESKEVFPIGTIKHCRGHGPPQGGSVIARPASKHDGKLGSGCNVYQSHGAWGFEGIVLEQGERTLALLSPEQALSLLAWLRQEEELLKQLAGGGETLIEGGDA